MPVNKEQLLKYTEALTYLFLGFAVIASQFSIAASSIGVGGLVILTAVKLLADKNLKYDYKTILYLTLLFVLAQVISAVFSNDPAHSFNNIYKKVSVYVVFFSALMAITDLISLKKFLAVFFIFTAVVCCVELVRFYIDYVSKPGTVPLSEYRLEYFGYPVTNGEIKMLILLIIIPLIFSKTDFILNKVTLILLSLPLFATFYLTNARNAILGLSVGLILYGILKNRYFLGGIIAAAVSFLLFAPLPVKERIISIADINHPSSHTRIVMWETGLEMIKDHPLIGIGDVDIKKAYEEYKKPEYHGEGSHMHNNIVQIAVTTGIIGLIIWLALMLYIIIRQVKIYLKTCADEFLNIMTVISLCCMAAFQVSGLTEWNFGDAEFAAPLWFCLALAFISERLFTTRKI